MTQAELYTAVRSMLEDPSGFRFTNSIIDRYTNEALRRVERSTGQTQRRLTLSLVQGQQEYLLPETGVLRVIGVEIIPEDGQSTTINQIQQLDLNNIPTIASTESDPTCYAIDIASGTDQNQQALLMYPPPARSTADAIVVTYEGDFTTGSVIPFPPTFDLIIQRLTAAGCLSESEDESAVRKGEYLRNLAEENLRDMAWMDSQSAMIVPRAFP